jgi:hypothetical protein
MAEALRSLPQPDRGGKSPIEISREYDIQSGG